MKTELFDNYSSFARPTALPCFVADQEMPLAVWANGVTRGEQSYDGWKNRVVITPLARNPHTGGMTPIGQSYRIGEAHLTRLILQSLHPSPTINPQTKPT